MGRCDEQYGTRHELTWVTVQGRTKTRHKHDQANHSACNSQYVHHFLSGIVGATTISLLKLHRLSNRGYHILRNTTHAAVASSNARIGSVLALLSSDHLQA